MSVIEGSRTWVVNLRDFTGKISAERVTVKNSKRILWIKNKLSRVKLFWKSFNKIYGFEPGRGGVELEKKKHSRKSTQCHKNLIYNHKMKGKSERKGVKIKV